MKCYCICSHISQDEILGRNAAVFSTPQLLYDSLVLEMILKLQSHTEEQIAQFHECVWIG